MEDFGDSSERIKSEVISELKKNGISDMIPSSLSGLKDLKILVVGDTIIDEYAYCETLGRAKKEPILVFKYDYSENFAGGILAIANHVSEFSNNVTLLTSVGNDILVDEMISKNLNKNISKKIFKDSIYPTLIKKRYVYSYRANKVFEVYNKDPEKLIISEDEVINYLEKNLSLFDMVIVGDFGHGMITDKIKETLCRKSKYLAINVQTNSSNLGFNLVTKFNKADYISLTYEELQLAMQDRKSDLKDLIKKLSLQTKCKKICITLGKKGILYFDNWTFNYMPIFSDKVVDTIGAGDAVFSLTSLLACRNADPMLIPFLGNCVGALAVQIMGNKEPVKSEKLQMFIEELFKVNLP